MSTTERLILAGGGGFCRELHHWVGDCHAAGRLPAIGGYLADGGPTLDHLDYGDMPWLGTIDDYVPRPGDMFVLAVGSPAGKRAIHGRLAVRGAVFPQVVHPETRIMRTARIGEGVIFCPQTAAHAESVIERFVTFNAPAGAGHDSHVGEFTTVGPSVNILGNVKIGRDVTIGNAASILPGLRVGDGATIGAGSVVYRSVPAGATVYAAPAKRMKAKR